MILGKYLRGDSLIANTENNNSSDKVRGICWLRRLQRPVKALQVQGSFDFRV